jgi:hypothetical protein
MGWCPNILNLVSQVSVGLRKHNRGGHEIADPPAFGLPSIFRLRGNREQASPSNPRR